MKFINLFIKSIYLLLISFTFLLFSCSKEDITNPGGPDGDWIKTGSADIYLVTDNKHYSFESMRLNDNFTVDAVLTGDSALTISLKSKEGATPNHTISFFLKKSNIAEGDVIPLNYLNPDSTTADNIIVYTIKYDSMAAPYNGIGFPNNGTYGTGELKITTLAAENIAGTFHFTAYCLCGNNQQDEKKVIVSNGKFDVPMAIQ